MTKHLVMFSGGIGSWYTARRVLQTRMEHGDILCLIFSDTLIEDEDLYRFVGDGVADLQALGRQHDLRVDYYYLSEGRSVWEVFFDVKYIGNTRIDPCSKTLKRDLIRKFIEAHFHPDDCIVYLGIDWTEAHRYDKARPYWAPFTIDAPLCEPPYIDKSDIFATLEEVGIEPPRLYAMGFPHNNCGGFCVKGGQGAFKLLLETMPERYAYHEEQEQRFREQTGKDVSILRDRRGGKTRPLTMRALRERVEAQEYVDELDLGGCACFSPESDNDTDAAVDLGIPKVPHA